MHIGRRRVLALAIYAIITTFAFIAAFVLRYDFNWYRVNFWLILQTLPLLVLIRLTCAVPFKLSRGRWRFTSAKDVFRLGLSLSLGTMVFYTLTQLTAWFPMVPRSVILIELVLNANLTAVCWLVYRLTYERFKFMNADRGQAVRTLIIGAGDAGNLLALEMLRMPTGYKPVAFVDDDPLKWGIYVQGLEVIGPTEDLADIVKQTRAEQIVIALPAAEPDQLRSIVTRCEDVALAYKVLPGIAEVLRGEVRTAMLREVRIEDLLGRDPIQLDIPELAEDLDGRAVMITGAAGSIGSELARQVARHAPDILILVDQAETALFYLELELQGNHPDVRLVCAIADIVDQPGMARLFEQYRPDYVFHAAAYKHVPMMESNPREAIRNNVIGTWRVAAAAGLFGAEKFVLVSTDKAVAPSSIMGATKRVAELVVLEMQAEFPNTAYSAVRFGNVLGSSGSVLPIFKKQIAEGQPLTVTHPDVTRYFMTIPEAVQLILQSSLLAEVRGRIAMLDMGQPVPIVMLAENLLRLSGSLANPKERIVFTGLRPGEKLHEELHSTDEETMITAVPRVRVIATTTAAVRMLPQMQTWEHLIASGQPFAVLGILVDLFPTLRSSWSESVVAHAAPPRLRVTSP